MSGLWKGLGGAYEAPAKIQVGLGGAWKTVDVAFVGKAGAWEQSYTRSAWLLRDMLLWNGWVVTVASWSDELLLGGSPFSPSILANADYAASGDYPPVKGIDGLSRSYGGPYDYWIGAEGTYLEIDFGATRTITKYRIGAKVSGGAYNYGPVAWKLYGSPNGIAQNELDNQVSRSPATWATTGGVEEITLAAEAAYRYFRLLMVTQNGGYPPLIRLYDLFGG
jgi:hypothetical protein